MMTLLTKIDLGTILGFLKVPILILLGIIGAVILVLAFFITCAVVGRKKSAWERKLEDEDQLHSIEEYNTKHGKA